MIKFNSLIDAITYRSVCPFCQTIMSIDASDGIYSNSLNNLDFQFNSNIINIHVQNQLPLDIFIDINNDSVELSCPVSDNINNKLSFLLNIDCDNCAEYLFSIEVNVLLNNSSIGDLYLIFEAMSYTDLNYGDYAIHNDYKNEITNFYFYPSEKDKKDMEATLPIIKLNVDNPIDTIARVRKLIIFS